MRKAVLALVLLLAEINTVAQVFDMDTIVFNGDSEKLINIVILSDGYTADELSKFVTDASTYSTAFFNEVPFSNYEKYFNIFIIKVPSNQSGASHPGTATDVTEPVQPVITVDNYFGSTFDYGNIHRSLVPMKTSTVTKVLAVNFPNYDQAIILVNSPYYGGSGGDFIVASTHPSSAQIALHEFGHTFSGLRDEFWPGDAHATEGVNMTRETDPSQVRWKNWIGTNLIGIYQHCCGGSSSLWYKPSENCKMEYLGEPFCSVCVEATIEKIHSIVSPLESYEPQFDNISAYSFPIKFKIDLIYPTPNTLKINWLLNNSVFKTNVDSLLIERDNLLRGNNTLRVIIEDTTNLLRINNHSSIHFSSVSWTINKSGYISVPQPEITAELYPNPATDHINIKINGTTSKNIRLELCNGLGISLKTYTLYAKGTNYIELPLLKKGIYFGNILIDNMLVVSKKIVVN